MPAVDKAKPKAKDLPRSELVVRDTVLDALQKLGEGGVELTMEFMQRIEVAGRDQVNLVPKVCHVSEILGPATVHVEEGQSSFHVVQYVTFKTLAKRLIPIRGTGREQREGGLPCRTASRRRWTIRR